MPSGLHQIMNKTDMSDNQSKKLFLLDAYALIFRSYYAFIKNPRITSKGMNTSAVFGFLLTLREVLQKQKPTHIAVVFDTPGPTFRHEMYKDYKGTRDETPEDIRVAVPYIKRLLEAYRIPVIDCPGYEADDVIGTLAKKASGKGFTTFMMTPDKDYAQLVSDNIFMFKPSRSGNDSVKWGIDEIRKEFSIERPEQVIDILALMGDTADNIPGAPGVGPKTAMKLISEFGSIEEVFLNTEKLKGKLKEIIENNKEQIELSKKLATIEVNVPVELKEEELITETPDTDKLKNLFEELEFRSIAVDILKDIGKKEKAPEQTDIFKAPAENTQGTLFGETETTVTSGKKATIDTISHSYILLDSEKEMRDFVGKALKLKEICFDTETTGIDALNSEIVALSFSWEKARGFLIYFPESQDETRKILSIFKPLFENPDITKIGQNIKFDIQVLGNYGIEVQGQLFDTMIAHYLLEPDMRHNMDLLSETFLSYIPVHIEELIGEKGKNQKNMRNVPVEKLKEYAVEDADVTFQLKGIFYPRLKG